MPQQEPEQLLQAKGLRLALPGREPVSFDLRVARGEAVQLCGPSGCGKTTALRMLARLEDPGPALLSLEGAVATSVLPQAWRRQVCYLAQSPVMLPGTVGDNLLAGFGVRHGPQPSAGLEQRTRHSLERLGLHPERIQDQDARTLSGGEAARVALARALALEPRVLLCDEPTASLDLAHGRSLASLLGEWLEQGGALVLVAHDLAPWGELKLRPVTIPPGEE